MPIPSFRSVWYFLVGAVLLAAAIGGGIWFYVHQNDADIRVVAIHVLSDLVPFLAALAIALWAEHVTKFSHMTRVVILLGGLAWSGVWGWRDLTDIKASKADIKGAITTAVGGANTHTDQQIAGVRKDVEGVDGKLTELKNSLDQGFSGLKPPPPQFANLRFGFAGSLSSSQPEQMRAGPDGIFTVNVMARNISDVSAQKGDVWIDICNECLWAEEPAGFDKPSGTPDFERHEQFMTLNSGVGLPEITLKIKTTKKLVSFPLLAKYSCETCGPMGAPQQLDVYVLPDLTIKAPFKIN